MAETANPVVVALTMAGALLILIAAIGVLRMPDLLARMQASSKAGTLGTILILAGVAVEHGEGGIVVRSILVIVFLFLTAPVAAHAIARAARRSGAATSTELVIDELHEDSTRRDRPPNSGAGRS